EDAELLAKLGKEAFYDAFVGNPLIPQDDLKIYVEKAFTVSQMTSELNEPNAIFLLAEADGEIAAFAKLEFGSENENVSGKNPIQVKRIYSRQKFIGFGVGAALMKRCLKEAVKGNHDTIWLAVWRHNDLAQKFYRKFGFEECGGIDFQLGNTIFHDKVMQRPVILENYESKSS
ncbi:MAG TPA: GNAT family N-acetyltransferase, partial [Pyrinomonadaceae bacterium]|nr:GNAT family N-acetyltransferase [Pyrinomonadaceae bacterium]